MLAVWMIKISNGILIKIAEEGLRASIVNRYIPVCVLCIYSLLSVLSQHYLRYVNVVFIQCTVLLKMQGLVYMLFFTISIFHDHHYYRYRIYT